MRNITVSVDDEVYRRARVRAAELDTSVSAVVRELLTRFASEDTEFDRRLRLQRETLESIRAFRASNRLSRDEAHDRNALR
jgi:plasmid stability protein